MLVVAVYQFLLGVFGLLAICLSTSLSRQLAELVIVQHSLSVFLFELFVVVCCALMNFFRLFLMDKKISQTDIKKVSVSVFVQVFVLLSLFFFLCFSFLYSKMISCFKEKFIVRLRQKKFQFTNFYLLCESLIDINLLINNRVGRNLT